ncbi:MAG: exodeoxyribonuclease III [Gammaproteobacteria bacterium]|nr:exodeoxyribonuclease III [Gammaproteobacteria bacterium]
MKVITVNVNGIRAAARKGFFDWLSKQNADFVCLQEIKAQEDQLTDDCYYPEGYHVYYHPAEKKGYSGVGLYSKTKPENVQIGLGWPDMDAEGRFIRADYPDFTVISLYLPSGSSSEERQTIKFDFLDRFMPLLREMKNENREFIICGDWNIAHKNIDLRNWRGNQKNSGFLPEERAWLDELFGSTGYVDAFRVINQEEDQYTWWSNRGQAWAKNVGWRIDYHVVTPGLQDKILNCEIYKAERFSDHAPLLIEYQV